MLWWEWSAGRRLSFISVMLGIAAAPWIAIGITTKDWRGLIGGTAFLFIPQIVAWMLFVGLKTGRMPSAYGRSETRTESPRWFWITGATYSGLLAFYAFGVMWALTIS